MLSFMYCVICTLQFPQALYVVFQYHICEDTAASFQSPPSMDYNKMLFPQSGTVHVSWQNYFVNTLLSTIPKDAEGIDSLSAPWEKLKLVLFLVSYCKWIVRAVRDRIGIGFANWQWTVEVGLQWDWVENEPGNELDNVHQLFVSC